MDDTQVTLSAVVHRIFREERSTTSSGFSTRRVCSSLIAGLKWAGWASCGVSQASGCGRVLSKVFFGRCKCLYCYSAFDFTWSLEKLE